MVARLVPLALWLQAASGTRVAVLDSAITHAARAEHYQDPLPRAKALSESLLAAAAVRDLELSEHLVGEMSASLAGDDGSMSMWLHGRILLAGRILHSQGLELREEQLGPHRKALTRSLGTPLRPDDPCAGWACAYWAAAMPADHARWRPRLETAALHARRACERDPSALPTLLWTHGMNAYAAALASDTASYEASVGSFADDVGADSVCSALALCPDDDHPRWLASLLLLAAAAADDAALQTALLPACTGSDASQGSDAMLAASACLLRGVLAKIAATDERETGGTPAAAAALLRTCLPLLPAPPAASACRLARLKAGNTNALSRLEVADGRRFLVREFGTQPALQLDRAKENCVFARLSARGLAPELISLFEGGRIEGWLEGGPCSPAECRTAIVYEGVAQALAALHTFPVDELGAAEDAADEDPTWGWTAAWRWLDGARGCADALEAAHEGYSPWLARRVRSLDLDSVERQLRQLHERLRAMALPRCYCHNDLSNTNVHFDRESGRVQLIDFEFGGANLRGFDLATHLSHWAGGATDGRYDDSAFPSRQEQRCALALRSPRLVLRA